MILAVLVTGCGAGSGAAKQLDTVRSWTATMQLATAEHHSGAVTTTYARQLDDAARRALADSRSQLAQETAADTARRAVVVLDSLDHAIRSLEAELHR